METRKKTRRLLRNTLLAGLSSASDVLLLVLFIAAARLLGVSDFGLLTTALSVSAALAFALNLGLDSLMISRLASNQARGSDLIGSVLIWRGTIIVVVIPVVVLCAFLIVEDPGRRNVILLFCGAGMLRSLNLSCRAGLVAFERFGREAPLVIAERVAHVVVGASVLLAGGGPHAIGLVFIIVRSGALILYMWALRAVVGEIIWRPQWAKMLSFQRQAWPLGAAVIISGIYLQLDVLVLSAISTDAEIGTFGAAYRVYEGMMVVPMILSTAFYPRMAAYLANSGAHFQGLVVRGLKYVLIVSSFLALLGGVFGDYVSGLLYGDEYSEVGLLLGIVAGATIFSYANAFACTAFRAAELQHYVLRINSLGLIVKFLVDSTLIPQMGAIGAAVAVLASSMAMAFRSIWLVWEKGWTESEIAAVVVRLAIVTVIAVAIGTVVRRISEPIALLSTTVVYLAGLYGTSVFDSYELLLVRRIVGRLSRP